MSVNPGLQFLADGLDPEPTYPIVVPPSGGIIIQGVDGGVTFNINGASITVDENGELVD